MSDDNEILTPPQVARRWGCKVELVHRLIREGFLRAFSLTPTKAKRQYKLLLKDVIAFEENGGTLGRTQPPAAKPKGMRKKSGTFYQA